MRLAALEFDPRSLAHIGMAMRELPRRVGIRVVRVALNAWGGIVRDKAAQLARRQSGLLAKSPGVKVTIPDASYNSAHHGKPAYVLVGPKRKSGKMLRKESLRGYGAAQRELKARRLELKKDGTLKPLEREKAAVRFVLASFKDAIYRNPSRYAHLVEHGHKKGKGRSSARGYPFIGPAQQTGNTVGFEKFKQKMGQGIGEEALAIAAKQSGVSPVLTIGA